MRVQKLLPDGSLKIEYSGNVRESNEEYISIDTGWSREPLDLGYVLFQPDDRWVETFYRKRWYNIFRIADRNGELKGFYINITKPPVIGDEIIQWFDLAIDIWVRTDTSYLVLDMDEFGDLELSESDREKALEALEDAKKMVEDLRGPLSELKS
ncbi:MAG: DUF402 domain-containing protein [Thermoplasmatota archaeon]